MKGIKLRKKITTYAILVYLVAYIFFYFFYIFNKYLPYSDIITAANMLVVTFLSVLLLGYHKNKKTYIKKEVFKITAVILVIYFLISFLLGLKFGFLKNGYSLKLVNIINNILAPVIIVISSEFLRYNIVSNNKYSDTNNWDDRLVLILLIIVLTVVDISTKISLSMFSSGLKVFLIITKTIVPSLVKNIMLTYLTYHVGYRSCILYRVFIDLNVYLLPYFPDLSDFFVSVFGIVLPFVVFSYVSGMMNEYNSNTEIFCRTSVFGFKDIMFIVVSFCFLMLMSGKYDYNLMSIVSGSMAPNINIGDVIVTSRVYDDSDIKINDVITYKYNNRMVVHRVVSKTKNSAGEYVYVTKGDANNSKDSRELMLSNIDGRVLFKIPYLGIPSIWFFNNFGSGSSK